MIKVPGNVNLIYAATGIVIIILVMVITIVFGYLVQRRKKTSSMSFTEDVYTIRYNNS